MSDPVLSDAVLSDAALSDAVLSDPVIGVCLKLVWERPEVDPLTGVVTTDPRLGGASEADQAALEWALRLASAWNGSVLAVTAGGPAADVVLQTALAAGAHRAVRVPLAEGAPSAAVASALAQVLAGCAVVCCGDMSADRGSGAVPALLAARLAAAQALGLLSISIGPASSSLSLEALRRLDGGRREMLRVGAPAVISVEGSTARLRRASLRATVAAGQAPIEVAPAGPVGAVGQAPTVLPYRPRPRDLPPPSGSDPRARILQLTAATSPRKPPRTLVASPDEAADAILDQLREWGELPY
jgi:electron transfer flavoprotein beta subunit